jgi:mannose-6-phosphate isomerase-like protein (cupin superfamily)
MRRMSDYAKVNLREVEDSAVAFGLSPDLEARFPKRQLGCRIAAVSLQRLAPGVRSSFGHSHGEQEELYVIVEGGGRMKLDDDVIDLARWDVVRVSPPTVRAFEAGPGGLELLAFGAPISEQGDTEMVPGWWTE